MSYQSCPTARGKRQTLLQCKGTFYSFYFSDRNQYGDAENEEESDKARKFYLNLRPTRENSLTLSKVFNFNNEYTETKNMQTSQRRRSVI